MACFGAFASCKIPPTNIIEHDFYSLDCIQRFQKYLHILMNLILLGLLALSLKLFSSHDLALRIACISKECTKSKVPSAVRKKMLHKFPKKYPNSSFGKFEYILKQGLLKYPWTVKFSFSEKATKICAIFLMVLTFT